jgi:FixJ family two-component response regulator
MTSERLYLLDDNIRRRAAMSHCLSGSGFHIEPFESLSELLESFPGDGILIVRNAATEIAALVEYMAACGKFLPIICFDEEPGPGQVVEAILAGALDFLEWPFSRTALELAVERAKIRSDYSHHAMARQTVAKLRMERLTRREREVLEGVTNGLSNKKIGSKLDISPRTVEIHRANMMSKMGASHTSAAIRIAIESTLIS